MAGPEMRDSAATIADVATDAGVSISTVSRVLNEREDVSVVVKADGLAGGKGVMVCQTSDEALQAVHRLMHERTFGAAGDRVVLEELLVGDSQVFEPEASTAGFSMVSLDSPPAAVAEPATAISN